MARVMVGWMMRRRTFLARVHLVFRAFIGRSNQLNPNQLFKLLSKFRAKRLGVDLKGFSQTVCRKNSETTSHVSHTFTHKA